MFKIDLEGLLISDRKRLDYDIIRQMSTLLKVIIDKKIFLYVSVFITGAVILVIEILGTRILAPFFGSTIFVWSSLITVTMGALALAYYLGGKIIDRYPSAKVFYSFILTAGLSLMLIMKVSQWVLIFSDHFGLRFGPLVAGGLLFSIPFFLLGVASPMAIRLTSESPKTFGSLAGLIFAIGTIGSIFGALAAGFFLLPYFTLATIFLFTGISLSVLAFLGLITSGHSVGEITVWFILLIVLLSVGIYVPTYAYKYQGPAVDYRIIYQASGFYGNLKVVDWGNDRWLMIDGATQSSINKESGKSSASYIREIDRIIQSRPQDKNILLLGLGGGALTKYFLDSQFVDIIEIDPKIVDIYKKYFGFTPRPNSRIIIDDARNFLRTKNKGYDLIIMDVYASAIIPIHLVTKEFFQLLRSRLNDDGLLVINFAGNLNSTANYSSSFIQTLKSVFPAVIVTAANDGFTSLVILASNKEDIGISSRSDYFKTVKINTSKASVFTDDKNSADTLVLPLLEAYWKHRSIKDLSFIN